MRFLGKGDSFGSDVTMCGGLVWSKDERTVRLMYYPHMLPLAYDCEVRC